MKKLIEKVVSMLGLYGAMLKKEEKAVNRVLENLDVSDLQNRPYNKWDRKFAHLTPILYKYDTALAFINHFGHVQDMYFNNLRQEDFDNIAFQRKLCGVKQKSSDGKYYADYPNLLYGFLRVWDFDDSIKAELKNDPDKQEVVRLYNLYIGNKKRNPL